ncbi:hypothetical protein BK736_24335 [Bacillus thuringiensis serovar poloniensis]|nr:hypothetical protein BK736_24335 [Bacillus thuringiensis serovar poloniensis]RNG62666.1 transposase [Bacillus thuringiensis]
MLWVIRSGAPWRDLLEHYGPWSSVYTRFRRWEKAGIFDRMLDVLAADPDAESVMIDASIVRVHQHGAGAKGGRNFKPSDDHEEAYPPRFTRYTKKKSWPWESMVLFPEVQTVLFLTLRCFACWMNLARKSNLVMSGQRDLGKLK